MPAFAVERNACGAPAAIDRYLLSTRHSAANPPAAVAAVDRWERQTDGRLTVSAEVVFSHFHFPRFPFPAYSATLWHAGCVVSYS